MSGEFISIVCPAFNESPNVARAYEAIGGALAELDTQWELIVVDDGSRDDTFAEVARLHAADPSVKGLRFARNFGKESAIRAGVGAASGDAIIVMDIDLQHPPEALPKMIALWRSGECDVVDCVKRSRGKESWLYKLCARGFSQTVSWLSGFDLSGATDYKLLDRSVAEAWLAMPETMTFYRGMIAWVGFRHARVEIDVAERAAGTTSWSFTALARLALTGVTAFSSFPLQLVSLLGLAFLGLALVMTAQTLYVWMSGESVKGFATVILLQLISSGAIMLALGVIGHYLGTMFYEVKRRPHYIVQRRIGIEPKPREQSRDAG